MSHFYTYKYRLTRKVFKIYFSLVQFQSIKITTIKGVIFDHVVLRIYADLKEFPTVTMALNQTHTVSEKRIQSSYERLPRGFHTPCGMLTPNTNIGKFVLNTSITSFVC